ncbi:MAG: acetate--CoA ligase [Pseudomonadota bacterium]
MVNPSILVDKDRKPSELTASQYDALYQQSIDDPEGFWKTLSGRLDWDKAPTRAKNTSFDGNADIKWYEDGVLNVAANCIDRHLPERANDVAIIWEGDNPAYSHSITYGQLHNHVCRFANVLKSLGVKKGDRVTIYMPMIAEVAYAMLACARIGAIHSVVFGGFSPEALAGRVEDCGSAVVITADQGVRAGKAIPLKTNVDKACALTDTVKSVVVVRHTGAAIDWNADRDHWYDELSLNVSSDCDPEPMNAEDPLFILYTSGSTGTPKGVVHTTGGYLLWASLTHEMVFGYERGDIYWCTADVGWVTGHSYIVYGPLANGATTLMFEGVPTYPGPDRFWRVVAKHNVNILYTAPTAIRSLMREGDDLVTAHDRSSLRVLGSVGEPINPEAWNWYHDVVGEGRCPIVDTWWQTETGGAMITPLPSTTPLKPGSATKPFLGVKPQLVDQEGTPLEGAVEGNLVITDSWPGQARSVYGDHDRFVQTYFSTYAGQYFTGDGARRDEDGYFWITGRVDDVLNVSGHRLGTAEIEAALSAHRLVSEAAVVGYPHDIKGQGIYCYVTLNPGLEPTEDLKGELKKWIRTEIGPVATPDLIQFSPGLPKTRSGKIMRRILRKIAEDSFDNLGDTSTLAEPQVVDSLIEGRQNR